MKSIYKYNFWLLNKLKQASDSKELIPCTIYFCKTVYKTHTKVSVGPFPVFFTYLHSYVIYYPLCLNVLHVYCIYMQSQRRLGHCYELHFWISWEFYRPWSPIVAIPIENRHCKLLSSFSSRCFYSLLDCLFKLFLGFAVHYTTCRRSAVWCRSLASAFLKMVNSLYYRFNNP